VFERKIEEAEAELLQAQEEKPGLIGIQMRLAMLHLSQGRFEQAIQELNRTCSADSLSPLLTSTEIVVRICARQFEDAVAYGKRALELHPYHQLSRFFYADALECAGRFEEALAEYRRASGVSPDLLWLRAMEGSCLAKSGRQAEALALLAELERVRVTEYLDPYHLALFLDALDRRGQAFAELERACEDNSSMLHMLDVDPKLDSLRKDARFAHILERAFRSALTQAQAS
jgi:tetratricopeptide (TPR) repeat protein